MKVQMKRWLLLLFAGVAPALASVALLLTLASAASAEVAGSVGGVVVDAAGPLAGATVRVRATDNVTTTAPDGVFNLTGLPEGEQVEVTAWFDGYYIASAHVTPTISGLTLTLRPYHTKDHPDYQWVSPISGTSPSACGRCHPMIMPQWESNAHGGAVANPRFFSLYNGTDLTGTLPVAPGYLDDFPDTAGNCASCHAPGAGVDGYLTTDMNAVRSVITAGIHCDYCHKIGGLYLDPATGSVYPNAPGVFSQQVLRPPAGDDIFFGPYDDIKDPDTYLPEISQSQFCAPCHQFSFWGTPIYESYDEWLVSAYADLGITCQDCHMPPTGDTYFALPGEGGLEHPPERIPSHLQLGASHIPLLQDTVTMTVSAHQVAGRLEVAVTITNTGAGHHVPTDHPGRHLILTVRAEDADGHTLSQVSGPVVPDWGGGQAGLPGVAFAKVLGDLFTGQSPVVSYWAQTLIVSDNRIPALGQDTSRYAFTSPGGSGPVTIRVELRFRRLFQDLMDAKGWHTPDILMEHAETTLSLQTSWDVFLPLIVH
jgi:hypothetical protein